MKIAVLGGHGFLGSAIVRAAREQGDIVGCVGRPARPASPTWAADEAEAIAGLAPDFLVHAAASPSTAPWSWDQERERLHALASLEIPTILIGSAAVFGGASPDDGGRFSEQARPHPVSDYGRFKYAQEKEALDLRDSGWRISVLRAFNPIGPGMKPSLMLGKLVRAIVDRERNPSAPPGILMGDLSSHRDFTHVDDVGEAVMGLAHAAIRPPVVHVGSGCGTLTRDVAQIALACAERNDLQLLEQSPVSSGPVSIICDPALVTGLTGWQPRRTLAAAIAEALCAERAAVIA